MVRMKLKRDEFDPDELDVEYEGPQFERYTGDVPKTGTILSARVAKGWWRLNDEDESQMPLLIIAEGNEGKLAEYNGLPIWEYLTWTPRNARRYQPFLMNFGLTVKDVFSKLDVEEDDDNIGTPVNAISDWVFGSDDALCRVVIKKDFYNDDWRAKIDWDGWLEYEDEEPEHPTKPAKSAKDAKSAASSRRGAASARGRSRDEPDDDEDEPDDDEYDDDDAEYDDDEDEDEQEAARPARSRSRQSSTRSSSRQSASRQAAPRQRQERPARTASRGGARSKSSSRRGGSSEEPPF